eukprot:TRINITY_DN8039_c0_g1_i2.p1 TRINITY_DN8039_c0_g1~~TRINITY_DN8039_c0_g1_i2.p1  ORF type:complete len:382 (+),score=-31.66 TRINITY_DN8039_c0_g1_i2:124-1269(+)
MALTGITVIEIAGLAPGPFCGFILSDFGADVIRVDRTGEASKDILGGGRRSIAINLKSQEGVEALIELASKADVFLEPFRPGVAERLGFGPDVLLARNPALVYARLTGFGQTGPYSKMAGHDINYIAASGALSLFGRKDEPPAFPVNILGDFAAGSLLCAFGITLALLVAKKSGRGQVVDASILDGTSYLSSWLYRLYADGGWSLDRGTNLLDSGAPFYDVYQTKDGKFMSVGALEPQFYSCFVRLLGLSEDSLPHQMDREQWPKLKQIFTTTFQKKTADEWSSIFDGTDACVVRVLDFAEAPRHHHNTQRHLFVKDFDGLRPAPAPRLSQTPAIPRACKPPVAGEHTVEVLAQFGFSPQRITQLLQTGVVSSTSATFSKL